MCGIAGIVRFEGGVDRDEPRLARMRDRLRHRGPDGDGMVLSPRCGLVHTRLALVDAAGGTQPIASPDGRFVLVYNGEIYEADRLRDALADRWTFRTRCDAEVVLAAYATWGEAAVARLEGMFAFFVWDAVREEGFAARDRLGVKPFVFAWDPRGELAFASEAKALLAPPRPRPRVRLEALLEVLVAPCFSGVEAPLFDGIEVLPPGHVLRVSRAGLAIERWGRHELVDDASPASAPELRDALERAVHRTLVADAPVGVFVSGGLDSTAIAAFAARAGAKLPGFTIAFEDQHRFDYERSRIVIADDEPFAALVERTLGIDRERVLVRRDGIADDLRAIARTNDALPAWEQEIAQHRLAQAASRRCKAVLVGDAADETHYGYHFLLDPVATRSPRAILERFAAPIVRKDVLADPIAYFDAKYRRLAEADGHAWEADGLLATTWLVVNRWLPRLLHNGDIHGMAHGLEARVPFADAELLAVARRVGPRRALEGGIEKAALREALRGLVPEAIRTRKKSALPKDQDVATIYQREAARVLADVGDELGRVIDRDVAERLCVGTIDEQERALLFRIVCLGHWLRVHEARLS